MKILLIPNSWPGTVRLQKLTLANSSKRPSRSCEMPIGDLEVWLLVWEDDAPLPSVPL